MATWREWLRMKRDGELANNKAIGHLMNLMLGKAWNSWMEYHERSQRAKRVSFCQGF